MIICYASSSMTTEIVRLSIETFTLIFSLILIYHLKFALRKYLEILIMTFHTLISY